MTARCAEEDVLLRLLDGELTENEAERWREHIRGCGVCAARSEELARTLRELKGPLYGVDPNAAVESMMRRLPTAVMDATAAPQRRKMAPWSLVGAGLAAALAISAIVIVPRFSGGPGEDPSAFTARGALVGPSMARAVGVSVYRLQDADSALPEGARVRPDDAYAVKYRNVLREPAYLLAFAVDATGTVHWICPAYLDAKDNPSSVTLVPSTTEALVSSAMQLDAPAAGALRFVAILTKAPLRVLDVDKLRAGDLSTASLRARWPTADIRELVTVHVDSR
jgi:hypothetical protein